MSSQRPLRGLFTELPTRKLNRISARLPRQGRHWCGCDASQVAPGERCQVCGVRCCPGLMRRREVR